MKRPTVLITTCDRDLQHSIRQQVLGRGFEVISAHGEKSTVDFYREKNADVVIFESSNGRGRDGMMVAEQLRRENGTLPLILITPDGSEDLAVAALRAGVNNYLKLPVSEDELINSIRRLLPRPFTSADGAYGPPAIVGESPQMQEIKSDMAKLAAADTTVFITGETGTGKDLVAELLHEAGPRRRKSFIPVNCAALPESLIESELFGHERGAFTGATITQRGKFHLGDGGTLFLNEIGEMKAHAQAKLLNAIERQEIFPLGASKAIPIDVRVIAATNRDPEALVEEGLLREDLYYRLNVVRVHLPPLRERRDDIIALLDHYIKVMNEKFGRQVEGFTEETLSLLLGYSWPGNVRELKNFVEATFVNLPPRRISFVDLPRQLQVRLQNTTCLSQSEREQLVAALFSSQWNKSKAAEKLCWSRTTLYRKMAHYKLAKMPSK